MRIQDAERLPERELPAAEPATAGAGEAGVLAQLERDVDRP